MIRWGFISTFLSVLLLAACTKQDAPLIKSEVHYTQSDLDQLKACQEFKPYNNQLSHETTLKMFECNKWEKQFPSLYQSIAKTDIAAWTHLFSPLDDQLFNSETGRKKFIGIFKNLETQGGLNDLGKMGEAFFKSPLVKIVADPAHKDDIKDFLKLLKLSPDKRQVFFRLFQVLNQSLVKNETLIKQQLYPFLTEEYLGDFRIWLADYWAKGIVDDNLSQDFSFVSKMFNPKLNEAWFYRWIKSDYVNQESVANIFEYPVIKRPEVHQDARYVQNILKKGFICKNNGNEMFFNVVPEIKVIINFLTYKDHETFFERQVDHKDKLLFFENVCDQIEVEGSLDDKFLPTFKRLFVNINEFLGDELNYVFTQGFHQTARFTKNDFYYLDFISGSFFEKLNGVAKLLVNHDQRGFYNLVYNLLKNNSAQDFSDMAAVFDLMAQDDEVKTVVRAYAKLWMKLSLEDKHKLASTFDVFFSPDVKSHLILESYLNFFKEFPGMIDELDGSYTASSALSEKTYQSMHLLAKAMNEPNTLKDLQNYFGENHMIKVVHAILHGYSASEETVYTLVSNQMDEVFIPYVPAQNYRTIDAYKLCVADLMKLTDKNVGYYEMMALYPASCKNLEHGPITHDLFIWYGKINQDYQKTYGENVILFDRDGILGKNALQQIVVAVVELGKAYKTIHPEEDLTGVVHALYEVIIKRDNVKFFETLFSMGGEYYRNLNPRTESSFQNILKKLIATPDDKIKSFISPVAAYLRDYKTFIVPQRDLLASNDCKDLNPNLGFNPCVSRHEVKQRTKKLIKILTRRFEGAPGLLEETLALLHPEGGVNLPYPEKGKVRKHYVSIEEIVRFFYHNQSTTDLRPMTYSTPEGTQTYQVDNVSSIEVVIRDIAFLNNFYGAFFMNTVASAKNYQKKVKKLEGQVNLMVNSGGILRKTNIYPKETAWLLKNVKSSYYGLIHVGDQFKLGSSYYSYADMMQAVLATVVKTSHPDVQKYTAFWLPNTKFGDLHNGEFLTQFVNLSGMRNLGLYLKSRLGNDPEKIFANKNFRRFNDELPKRIHLKTLQETLRHITDNYAKNDSDVFYEAIDDMIDWTNELSPSEISKLEDFIVNSGLLLTYSTDPNVDQWLGAFKDILKVYRPLKSVWPSDLKLITLIDKANSFFEFMLQRVEKSSDDKTWFNQLLSVMKSMVLEQPGQVDEIINLIQAKPLFWITSAHELMNSVEAFYKSLSPEELKNMDIMFKELMASKTMNFTGLKFWLKQTTEEGKHKNEILRLMDFLSKSIKYENEETTYFKVMISEFLGKEGDDLGALLKCMSDVITLK